MSDVAAIIDFLIEVEKLKGVERKTSPIGLARKENSAEHSWHLCVLAVLLHGKANAAVDLLKVLKMLIVHDLGEIDAGDTLIYAAAENTQAREEAGMRRICQLLPPPLGDELMALWLEFVGGATAEAQFAQAIDRVPPIVQNLQTGGQTWRPLGIAREQVLAKNSLIKLGCT
ncbi:MAG TPA: HD domain-containing protein, partial [Cellvibrionaceae bacterium]|nr:HD domain-containing protein [Cellvibrionaceae bacterium]